MRKLVLIIAVMLLAGLTREASAAGYLGIITADVGDKACTIVRGGQKLPCTTRKIYAGDELVTNVPLENLRLVVHPAAETQDIGEGRIRFVMSQPSESEGLVKKFMNRFFTQEKHYAVNTVTRDWGDSCRRMAEYAAKTPPATAAVLAGEPVRFPVPERARRITVTDASGAQVYIAPVSGLLVARPAELGLASGQDYQVAFEGLDESKTMRLHVVDETSETRLAEAVRSLAVDSPPQAPVLAAAYYQMESDLSGQDYYFLSWQQLPADLAASPDRDAACNILARYVDTLPQSQ